MQPKNVRVRKSRHLESVCVENSKRKDNQSIKLRRNIMAKRRKRKCRYGVVKSGKRKGRCLKHKRAKKKR